MQVGRYTYGHNFIDLSKPADSKYELYIGNFCSIAQGVFVYLGGHHRSGFFTTYPFGKLHRNIFHNVDNIETESFKGDVVIGNDVWVGMNTTIFGGVTIGDGAIIAANSHVVKDVPPYSISGGNPCKHIKYRFSEKVIEKLLDLKWWDLPDEEINKIVPILCSNEESLLLDI